ncbi:HAD-IA family hydrolase [Actinocorallia longicatena]|uniref:Sugar phosphatase n=1 Tax=Actinocorallia longicatena TaxID=111803 RepID=A0ABP6QAW3_9ACTN
MKNVAAVLFDMDGTLVDSDAVNEHLWRLWARRFSLDEQEVAAFQVGRPAPLTIRRFLPRISAAEFAALVAEHEDRETHTLDGVTAAKGAHDVLSVLAARGLPWAVVTSAGRPLAEVRLAASGIAPPVLVTLHDVPAGKPDPSGYLQAAASLGVDPARCLVVEDSETGAEAGRAAGMRVATLKGLPGDPPLAHLGELAGLLDL